jgi:hypothetical protein
MEKMVTDQGNICLQDGYLQFDTLDHYIKNLILQDLVQLIAASPNFDHLTSKEYDLELRDSTRSIDDDCTDDCPCRDEDDEDGYCYTNDPPSYVAKTQRQILQWKPELWWIPDRTQLNAVLQFLPAWPTEIPDPVLAYDYVPRMYFSAAAVAIRSLERLSPSVRNHLRSIVIQEDHPSVALSKTHSQGLIPFCLANPHLRIERRVNVWSTEFVYRTNFFALHVREIINLIATWINEVKVLYQMGMPADSFTLVLHGPSKHASQQLSEAVVRAAIWHEGALEIARREQRTLWAYDGGLANDFVDVIKKMLRGEIPARFDAELGEVWDIQKILREHIGEWPVKVSNVLRLQDFEEPDGGWEAARELYQAGVVEANGVDD